jgi:hypothetical protein
MTTRTTRARTAPETGPETWPEKPAPDSGAPTTPIIIPTTTLQAWLAVMAEVQGIGKGDFNDQQKFHFRGIDAVMNAVGPALRKYDVAVLPISVDDVTRERYDTTRGTSMVGTVLKVTYGIHGPDGDVILGQSIGESSDAGDKGVTKAMSVAYRTFLLQALTIPTDESDPDLESHQRTAAAAPRGTLSLDGQEGYKRLLQIKDMTEPAERIAALAEWQARAEDLGVLKEEVMHEGQLVTLGGFADRLGSDGLSA